MGITATRQPPSAVTKPSTAEFAAPPRELRSETAVALLDAAEKLFSQHGYAAVGIREIADQAGANIASIKYHFGSKRDLYRATIRETMNRREDGGPWSALETPPASRRQACAAIVRFTRGFIREALGDEPPHSCAMLMTREAMQPSEAIDEIVRDYVLPRMQRLELAVGMIRPEACAIERSELATGVLSQILYYVVFRAFAERTPNLRVQEADAIERLAGAAASFSLRGLGVADDQIDAAVEQCDAEEAEEHRR